MLEYLDSEVDPAGNPVKYDRTDNGLEAWMLFCVMVAGKGANQTKAALKRFLATTELSPFDYIRNLSASGQLESQLINSRAGQYSRLSKCFLSLASHDITWLRTCSAEELEALHGIGMKTSRFFILSTRPSAMNAALDTHLLKELRTANATPFLANYNLQNISIPTATPPRTLYLKLEKVILDMAAAENLTPAEYDYKIWYKYYNGN